ncbi:hypothetical protein IE53DRAFT_259602 [Violaceomyces palustris]|uniref:Uncharacterized protein n=1 Tax=Violaceomyces palustris TaxID=1673888 RepID=A0ACD0NN31_9BASI|nr:hypothetical protein IE53DRAFT_259602 [Violaceomyces palustris]
MPSQEALSVRGVTWWQRNHMPKPSSHRHPSWESIRSRTSFPPTFPAAQSDQGCRHRNNQLYRICDCPSFGLPFDQGLSRLHSRSEKGERERERERERREEEQTIMIKDEFQTASTLLKCPIQQPCPTLMTPCSQTPILSFKGETSGPSE